MLFLLELGECRRIYKGINKKTRVGYLNNQQSKHQVLNFYRIKGTVKIIVFNGNKRPREREQIKLIITI